MDFAAGCAYLNGEELHLTPIEYKLLCLLSRNVGKVLTHTYITQNIWGSSWDNDIASLRVFMATLRKKLEKNEDSTQYIQTHIRRRIQNDESGMILILKRKRFSVNKTLIYSKDLIENSARLQNQFVQDCKRFTGSPIDCGGCASTPNAAFTV